MGIRKKTAEYKKNMFSAAGLSVREHIGYCGGIFGNTMGQDSSETYGDKFQRDFMGIPAPRMFIKDNIATVISFIAPVFVGAWYDKPAKLGKKDNITRAISFIPIPFTISAMLLFVVPSESRAFNFIWATFFSLLFKVVDTFYDMAMDALALKIVRKPSDRKNFYTISSLASTLGSMLPGWIMPLIIGTTSELKRQQWLYFLTALGFAMISIVVMYAPYFTVCKTKANLLLSRVAQTVKEDESPKISWDRETIGLILHNRPFVILMISKLCELIRQITYQILPYLYENTFDDLKLKPLVEMLSGALGYVGIFSVPVIGKKVSARNIHGGGYAYSALLYGVTSIFNINFNLEKVRKSRRLIGILIGLSGMPNHAQSVARKMILSDSTDYMEWYARKNGISVTRCDGLLIATQNITNKANSIIKSNVYNALLLAIGYKEKAQGATEKAVQTNSTLKGIFMIATLCGLVGNAVAAICMMFDNYVGKRKEAIYAELTEMRAAENKLKAQAEQ